MTSSLTASSTFTIADAKYVTSKLGADLLNLHARYGRPDRSTVADFVLEAALALRAGYLETVDFGFKSGDHWILRLRYRAVSSGGLGDATPGALPRADDVADHPFHSFLCWNSKFTALTATEQRAFRDTLPIQRTSAAEPSTGAGTYSGNAEYSRNGTGLSRDVFRAI